MPAPTPARIAAPNAPGSSWATTSNGMPETSACNCSHQSSLEPPPVARTSDASMPRSPRRPIVSENSHAIDSNMARMRSTPLVASVMPSNVPPRPWPWVTCWGGVSEATPGRTTGGTQPNEEAGDGAAEGAPRPTEAAHPVGVGAREGEPGGPGVRKDVQASGQKPGTPTRLDRKGE